MFSLFYHSRLLILILTFLYHVFFCGFLPYAKHPDVFYHSFATIEKFPQLTGNNPGRFFHHSNNSSLYRETGLGHQSDSYIQLTFSLS